MVGDTVQHRNTACLLLLFILLMGLLFLLIILLIGRQVSSAVLPPVLLHCVLLRVSFLTLLSWSCQMVVVQQTIHIPAAPGC